MIRKGIWWCMLLSHIGKLCRQGDTLIKKLVSAPDRVYSKTFGTKGDVLGMSRKINTTQLLKIQPGERLAATTELNLAPIQLIGCSVGIP